MGGNAALSACGKAKQTTEVGVGGMVLCFLVLDLLVCFGLFFGMVLCFMGSRIFLFFSRFCIYLG